MEYKDYVNATGILTLLKYHLKPNYHSLVDEIIEALITDCKEKYPNS